MIIKIENDKPAILRKNVVPDVIFNRFDILYGTNFDLYKISGSDVEHYIPVHRRWSKLYLGMYMMDIDEVLARDFIDFCFRRYKFTFKIEVKHCQTRIDNIAPGPHWHINLPSSIEEFDKTLSNKTRYNTKWYPKKIIKDFGTYEIRRVPAEELTQEIVDTFHAFKKDRYNTDHSTISPAEYVLKSHITEAYVLYLPETIGAILFLSCTKNNAFLENITYNPEFASYSLGSVLYHHTIKKLISSGMKNLFLLGGNLEYKKRFNGQETTTYTGASYRKRPSFLVALRGFLNIFNDNNRDTP